MGDLEARMAEALREGGHRDGECFASGCAVCRGDVDAIAQVAARACRESPQHAATLGAHAQVRMDTPEGEELRQRVLARARELLPGVDDLAHRFAVAGAEARAAAPGDEG